MLNKYTTTVYGPQTHIKWNLVQSDLVDWATDFHVQVATAMRAPVRWWQRLNRHAKAVHWAMTIGFCAASITYQEALSQCL